jgi:hypothetical protein
VRPIKWLLERGTIVIAAGGGGIPTVYEPGRKLRGIDAVIDKAGNSIDGEANLSGARRTKLGSLPYRRTTVARSWAR